jgi:hypothetical protein
MPRKKYKLSSHAIRQAHPFYFGRALYPEMLEWWQRKLKVPAVVYHGPEPTKNRLTVKFIAVPGLRIWPDVWNGGWYVQKFGKNNKPKRWDYDKGTEEHVEWVRQARAEGFPVAGAIAERELTERQQKERTVYRPIRGLVRTNRFWDSEAQVWRHVVEDMK